MWPAYFAGKESTPPTESKGLQAKRKRKGKKGENPSSVDLLLADDDDDDEAPPTRQAGSTLESSLSQDTGRPKKHDVNQAGEGKILLHGKQGRKGAEIGAALQKGLLGTVMTPEEPLAPGWD